MARFLRVAASGLATASVVEGNNYSYFCQQKCGNALDNSCSTEAKCESKGNCSEVALEPFTHNDGVCEAFSNSGPVCDSTTHVCFEAIDFQLVWDRHKDFMEADSTKEWAGIELEFLDQAAIFAPGAAGFHYKADVSAAIAQFHEQQDGTVKPFLKQVLTSGEGDGRVIHATGTWSVNGSKYEDLPFYSRWVENVNGHWVMETLLVDMAAASWKALAAAAPQNATLFGAIKNRSAEYTKAYNAGDFDKVTSFYADGAVIVPQGDRPFMKADIKSKKSFLGSKADLDSKIVIQAPGSDAAHEVGFSSSTSSGYLARWTKEEGEWLLESQVFSVFPKAGTEILI